MGKQLKLLKVYCIDTSVLFNLKEYPRDVFPTIWKMIEDMVESEQLISHIEVYRETQRGKDEISHWCVQQKRMFKDIDDAQIREFQNVKTRYDQDYWNREINGTGPWADPWVVATSLCERAIIVSDEANKPNRIPAIAQILNVTCLNRLDFFRQIGVKY